MSFFISEIHFSDGEVRAFTQKARHGNGKQGGSLGARTARKKNKMSFLLLRLCRPCQHRFLQRNLTVVGSGIEESLRISQILLERLSDGVVNVKALGINKALITWSISVLCEIVNIS